MLEYIFKAFLLTSLIGTVLTLLLTAIRPITRKFISSKWHYYLWLIVLVAMIVPFRFAEQVSQQPNENITIYSPIQESFHGEVNEMVGESNDNQMGIIDFLKLFADAQMQTIAMIWIAGACLMFLSKLLSYGLFMVELRKNSEVISCPELKRFTDKNIITRAGDKFSSPLMVGVFRPILLLPKVSMTEEQLNNVLSHEMIHYRRKDILYKWFVCLVKCIHWFNPAIYYVSKQIDIECEISCDAAVVKNMSDEEQTRYIDTIITLLAAGNRKQATITTGMVSDKKTLQRRFTMIKNKIKMSKKTVIIVAVLALAVIGGTVFASGMLNGNLIEEPEDEIVLQTNKEPKLKKVETENGEIVYDKENGEVVSATSEPKLVTAGETDADPQQQKLPRIEKKTSEKATNTEIVVDATENGTNGPLLKEIEFDADFESNPVEGEVSLNFGKRTHPITNEVKEHNGIDIKAPEGTNVVSSINGTVTDVGFDAEKGNYIVVENGNLKTLYAQLTEIETNDNGVAVTTDGNATVSVMSGNKKEFVDVHHVDHWSEKSVDFVHILGLMNGTSENHFSPDVDLTRAMLVTVLYRAEGEPEMKNAQWFEDVEKGQWYSDAVAWATFNGITMGYGNGNFGPNDNITREQIVAIMHRYAQYKGYDVTQGGMLIREYSDYENVSDYALNAMTWSVNIGMLSGRGNNNLAPQSYATRAEVAAILERFIKAN